MSTVMMEAKEHNEMQRTCQPFALEKVSVDSVELNLFD